MFSTVENVMSTVGGGGVQYRRKCHEYRGGYLEYHGDIMMHVGGHHEYRAGCSVPWGETVSCCLSTPRYSRYPPRY